MSIDSPRSREDFNNWYNKFNGDPWGYQHSSVKRRLTSSINFLKKHIPIDYQGSFIELGAFNGDFSYLLASNFKNSTIVVNDISDIALKQAKEKTKIFKNIVYNQNDLAGFQKPENLKYPLTLLLLECLYYLKNSERETALNNLINELNLPDVYFSAPIIGSKYFVEEEILTMFSEHNYQLVDYKILNLKSFSFLRLLIPMFNGSKLLRNILSNQVIYFFKPKDIQ